MAKLQVKHISLKHEVIMDFMLANPTMPLGTVAEHFGFTQAYFSVLIHSDAFKDKLRKRRDSLETMLEISVRDRITGAVVIGLEKLGNVLHESVDPQFILDATDKLLHRAGYAPTAARSSGGNAGLYQQNNFYLSRDDLARLRPNMHVPALPTLAPEPEPALDAEYEEVAATDRREAPSRHEDEEVAIALPSSAR